MIVGLVVGWVVDLIVGLVVGWVEGLAAQFPTSPRSRTTRANPFGKAKVFPRDKCSGTGFLMADALPAESIAASFIGVPNATYARSSPLAVLSPR
ncbi:MAG: hypothetical protein FWD57_12325 [Polyangiaceae bacterium]|nr:hypothetical protein [Polyangiaceae bacterium]